MTKKEKSARTASRGVPALLIWLARNFRKMLAAYTSSVEALLRLKIPATISERQALLCTRLVRQRAFSSTLVKQKN